VETAKCSPLIKEKYLDQILNPEYEEPKEVNVQEIIEEYKHELFLKCANLQKIAYEDSLKYNSTSDFNAVPYKK
jgi:hypothetical protein